MIKNKMRYFDAQFRGLRITYGSAQSQLPPLPFGLCLLLGKNGTGKSSLLSAFKAFREGIDAEFPRLAIGYQLPSAESHSEFHESIQAFKNSRDYERYQSADYGYGDIFALDRELFNLPMTESLLLGLEKCWTMQSIRIFDAQLDAVQILQLFKFSDHEIQAFVSRREKAAEEGGERSDYFVEEFSVAFGHHYQEYFAEFFLTLLSTSTLWTSDNWGSVSPIELIRSDIWLTDPEYRDLLVSALREMFANGLFELVVDNKHGGSGHGVRFVCQPADHESVQKYLSQRNQLWNAYVARVNDPQEFGHPLVFPYDLLEVDPTGLCITATVPIGDPPISGKSINSFFSCAEVLPQADAAEILKVLEDRVNWKLSVETVNSESGSGRYLAVSGTATGLGAVDDLVMRAAVILRDCDIGIQDLRVEPESITETFFLNEPGISMHGLPNRLYLFFRGSEAGNWRSIDTASDGQRTALHAVFQILTMTTHPKQAGLNLVVADEFDRHLHPTSADRLLSQLHKVAGLTGTTFFISTHSVPLLKSRNLRDCVRVYSERDALDRISLTLKPKSELMLIAETLGTNALSARSLFDLHLVVEGETDVSILEHFLNDPRIDRGRIEFVSLDGIKNLKREWMRSLYFLTSPILIVYDRRSTEFEGIWDAIIKNPTDYKDQHALINLRRECRHRRDAGFQPGDTELASLLDFAGEVLDSKRYPDFVEQARRITFFGIEVDDMVDYLPISRFWKSSRNGIGVSKNVKSWEQAKAAAGFREGSKFKVSAGITKNKVKRVLQSMQTENQTIDSPRLSELLGVVIDSFAQIVPVSKD